MWWHILGVLLLYFTWGLTLNYNNTQVQHKNFDNKIIFENNYYIEKYFKFKKDLHVRLPRKVDTTFRGKPRAWNEILAQNFGLNEKNFQQTNSLINLVNKIAKEYLSKCPPIIYYDSYVKKSDDNILETLFQTFPISYYHGEINDNYKPKNKNFLKRLDSICKSYILFLSDPLMTHQIIGSQTESRVVLIARSSQWKLKDFLSSQESSKIINLLVIGESLTTNTQKERPYVLYTHHLYADGLGSNKPIVLTSWINGALSRTHVNLFPTKFSSGFAGHRFRVSASNQPPFIFRITQLSTGGSVAVNWDGIEYRLLTMIGEKLNFSIEIATTETIEKTKDIIETIQYQIYKNNIDMGMAGVYITEDRLASSDMSIGHSTDCAAFITLASKALPKYRAILGPFQWPVWVALTFVYLGAVFPIVYSDRLTLKHLLGNWGEIENMFWYVFGMFTNSFSFSGKYSWSNSQKISTRLMIGTYWLFTIIITSCYTGSIIAFVTLPAFPDTIDSISDLLSLFFRVGTLDNGGWEHWFQNSTHKPTAKLYNKMEFVSSFEEGIGNVTQSFFWNYAFLASQAQLEYLVQSNFSNEAISRRSVLHISDECFALFQIGFVFPQNAVYKQKINSMILLAQQSGLVNKIRSEVKWTMQRSSTGKLLQASSAGRLLHTVQEERQLTTADTEGMFLLMGIGYLIGAIALISEIVGGITNRCRQIIRNARRTSKNLSSPASSTDNLQRGEKTKKRLKQVFNLYNSKPIHKSHRGHHTLPERQSSSSTKSANSYLLNDNMNLLQTPNSNTESDISLNDVDLQDNIHYAKVLKENLNLLDQYLKEDSSISESDQSLSDTAVGNNLFGSAINPHELPKF